MTRINPGFATKRIGIGSSTGVGASLSNPVLLVQPVVGVPVAYLPGSRSGTAPITFDGRQWLLDGAAISGQTGLTYTPTAGDIGHTLSVRETIHNAYGTAQAASSALAVLSAPAAVSYGHAADAGEVDDGASYAGTVYYIDLTSGSDSNSGLSPAAPFLTLAKVRTLTGNSGSAPAGSAFLFKRGSSGSGYVNVENFAGGSYTFGAYGTGARPELIYSGGNSHISLFFFNKPGCRVRNLLCNGNSVVDAGPAYPAAIANPSRADWRITNCEVKNFTGNGVTLNAASLSSIHVVNCHIHDCCVSQANGAGIDGGGVQGVGQCSDVQVISNTVENCGNGLTSHNIYLDDIRDSIIQYNLSRMTSGGNHGGNHGLVLHGTCNNVEISDNWIDACHNGIGANDGYGSGGEVFDNTNIRRNLITNCGTLSGQTQGQPMELACMQNSEVSNNIAYSNRLPLTIAATRGSGGGDTSTNNLNVFHNTLVVETDTAIISMTGAMTGVSIKNNIFYSLATTQNVITKPAALSDAQISLDYNEYYTPSLVSPITWDGTAMSLATLQSSKSKEMHAVAADPLFVNLTAKDLRLQSGSLAKAAGVATSVAADFGGNGRSVSAPSIGAYE